MTDLAFPPVDPDAPDDRGADVVTLRQLPQDDIPVFGAVAQRPDPVPFRLVVTRRGQQEQEGPFRAVPLFDATVLELLGGRGVNQAAAVAAVSAYLARTLVDDDGVSWRATPERVEAEGDQPAGWMIAGSQAVFPSAEAATEWANQPGVASSQRRWEVLENDRYVATSFVTLTQVVMHLIAKASQRPTQPSAHSAASSPARTAQDSART